MKLPNGERAIVDEGKVREYLLSTSHPVGRFKAKFFHGIGFGPENWREFVAALRDLAATGDAELIEDREYGRKYLIVGAVSGSMGRTATVISVWILFPGADAPQLVTVYPR